MEKTTAKHLIPMFFWAAVITVPGVLALAGQGMHEQSKEIDTHIQSLPKTEYDTIRKMTKPFASASCDTLRPEIQKNCEEAVKVSQKSIFSYAR